MLTVQRLTSRSAVCVRAYCAPPASYEMIKVSRVGSAKNIGFVELHRPQALNALCDQLMREVAAAMRAFDNESEVGAIILTGSGDKAFAAGADIKEMKELTFADVNGSNFLSSWSAVAETRKPIIAAINGYALGGGLELAMMCDVLYASEKAVFGQPEILLGTIPGAGGTQRLTHAVGKSLAMELCLSGNKINAARALQAGLVSAVHAPEELVPAAIKLAETIAKQSQPILRMAKESVSNAYEMSLREGCHFERRLFHATFATADRKEGMAAFSEKRAPNFKHI
jgi:enoyl-CoA hydratase